MFVRDRVRVWEGRSGSEGAVVEGGDYLEREIDGRDGIRDDGLERGEKVELGAAVGLHARLELGSHGLDC